MSDQEPKTSQISPLLYKVQEGLPLPEPAFELQETGLMIPLDYSQYGEFQNVGTPDYQYIITRPDALKKAIGAGIYPHEDGVLDDPVYQRLKAQGLLNGSHWDYVKSDDVQTAFYIWTHAPVEPGIRTFFTAYILEKAGHILSAVKTYRAALVHFPEIPCWSADKSFVWYIGPAALANIQRLCRDYPDLNCALEDASIDVQNGLDTVLTNDIITVNPGRLITKTLEEKRRELSDINALDIIESRGGSRVKAVQFSNGHWQMRVDGKPFFVRGMTYGPTEIGLGPGSDLLYYTRWMFTDKNNNGLIDAPYDAWVDKNNNGRQDADEPAVGDFQIMKDIGINAIRFFTPNDPITEYAPSLVNKPLLRDLYETYGIRVIVGDFLGAYTLGSGASWEKGTDYTDAEQRRKMKEVVRAKVMDLKDEPFVLMWLLGNENNMPVDYKGVNATRTNASVYPKAYARFVNEVAEMIHELDGRHPVAIGNVELGLLEYYQQYAPAIDILGINAYHGSHGFDTLWQDVKKKFDRPVMITEYGCDAYYHNRGPDEEGQMEYHQGNFRDIVFHQAGGPYTGNAIGGIIFEYLDEWWKDTFGHPEDEQQTAPQNSYPFADGQGHEEWFGIVSQGSGKNSPVERRLRKAYFYYKEFNLADEN